MKKCKQGYYYCYKDKKCKRIPGGYRVGLGGYLRREREEERSEDSGETETKKNGNGNGNGNGGNGNSGNGNGGGGVSEAVMSPAQKRKDTMLKKKYDDSDMKKNFIKQYGKEEGLKIYYAYIRKQAMEEGWSDKYKKSIDCDNPKGFSQKAHCQGRKKKMNEEKKKDHEYSMARSELKTIKNAASRLQKKMGKTGEGELKAWVQSKITKAADYIDTAADYVTNEETCPICGHDPCQCLEGVITEKRDGKSSKDKGYSLRDWFRGGGWKQTGGKYDGKPCAKQPGQKTKPYCRDADDRAAMSKEERNKRARKKRKEDPNPNRKGKARNVKQESYSNWRQDLHEIPVIPLALGAAAIGGGMYLGKKASQFIDKQRKTMPNDYQIKRQQGGLGAQLSRMRTGGLSQQQLRQLNQSYKPEGEVVEANDPGPGDPIRSYDKIMRKNKMPLSDDDIKRMKDKGIPLDKAHYEPQGELVDEEGRSVFSTPGLDRKKKVQDYLKNTDKVLRPQKPTVELDKAHYEPEGDMVDEGKKDACYYKVKSRYSVWPSAYASGALVKCRKVGAKNWGNKSKKNESVDYSNWRDDFIPTEYETTDLIKADPIQVPPSNLQKIEEAKKCWKGYKKVGTQKLFGKTYNRCEKIKKEHYDWRSEINIQEAMPGYDKYNAAVAAANKLKGREKIDALKAAAALRPKTEKEVNQKLGEDWQKSNRNDGVDGMSQKSVDAYRRENPGSKLKTAVTGKVKKGSKDAKRRKSFCSRSDGQRKMHNIDCKKTPDKKICKARRRWKC